MKKYWYNTQVNAGTPKRGSVADFKRGRAFEDRTISTGKAIAEGVCFVAAIAAFVLLCAVA